MRNNSRKSTVDLILLGFFIEEPRNAYDLALLFKNSHLGRLLKISSPGIYKNCKMLHADGYLQGSIVRDGEAPEKVIYNINDIGRERFLVLMNYFSQEIQPFYFAHNAFIWNLDKMDRNDGMAMLGALRRSFISLRDWMKDHEAEVSDFGSYGARALIRQYRMVMETLVLWIDETMADYTEL
ncbi:MAG: PadR family transcriptional regulator [Spirochaetaceae bacterium]|nr:PadR family transcriptional regulator [Spirochaetaceae bacterium]